MPYIPLKHSADDRIEINLGLWKASEQEDYFLSRLNIYENEAKILQRITHPVKRLEWLSSRLALKELLKINHKVESLNFQTGKPYLSDYSHNICYSHSNLTAAVIASTYANVAIDLEDLTKNRNLKTRFLFMAPSELAQFEKLGDLRLFFLIWSAKETLYKIYGEKGLAFKDNLLINPEGKPIEQNGTISGIIQVNEHRKEYTIYYRFFSGILLTYTYDADGVPEQGRTWRSREACART